jgi:hypothetical protein
MGHASQEVGEPLAQVLAHKHLDDALDHEANDGGIHRIVIECTPWRMRPFGITRRIRVARRTFHPGCYVRLPSGRAFCEEVVVKVDARSHFEQILNCGSVVT